MTAADVIQLRSVELPMLASDPRVRVVADVELDRLESCEVCVCRSFSERWAPEVEIPVGRFRLTYHFRPGGPEHQTDLCGAACSDSELAEVLNLHNCVGVVLHVPAKFLPGGTRGPVETPQVPVAVEHDDVFLIYDALMRLVRDDVPNTATVDMSGRDGFEHCRHALMVKFASLGINRAEQLRRGAA